MASESLHSEPGDVIDRSRTALPELPGVKS